MHSLSCFICSSNHWIILNQIPWSSSLEGKSLLYIQQEEQGVESNVWQIKKISKKKALYKDSWIYPPLSPNSLNSQWWVSFLMVIWKWGSCYNWAVTFHPNPIIFSSFLSRVQSTGPPRTMASRTGRRNEGSVEFTHFCSLSSASVLVVFQVLVPAGFSSCFTETHFQSSAMSCSLWLIKGSGSLALPSLSPSFLPWRACW